MHVRDAVEADAAALATIADTPTEAMRSVIHDRTVYVALDDSPADPGEEETDPDDVLGFLSFDARDGTVHVTQFGGARDVCARLLEEPLRFASSEAMGVELLVLDGEDEMREAAESAGFHRVGTGPRFEGEQTTRYRLEAP
ncbi:hypothetical protein HUG10_12195 [Halorarum halophilum]|uniref:N-acetyltransferase domain-containing protein n=1 Tax=Halorarum halophilum TaxID=2743090 RepID=A0A7D5KN62_9EURY|nr:hypothetical protein [Halobaculum halophilum]QLG28262.1 hypothetical protein HUG10_12195 [Halobaculum halophilum]